MATQVYYSVCPFGTDNLLTAAGSTHATIVVDASGNATITLNDDSLVNNIGQGVCVEYNSIVSYIDSITDYTHFHLTDEHGVARGAQASTALTSVHHVWATIAAADGAADDAAFLNLDGDDSLIVADVVLNLACYYDHVDNTPDTTSAALGNMTQDSTRYTRFYTPTGGSQSVNRQRHLGKWSTSYWHMIVSIASGSYCIRNDNTYQHYEGLQLKGESSDGAGSVIAGLDGIGYVDSTIFWLYTPTAGYLCDSAAGVGNIARLTNCIGFLTGAGTGARGWLVRTSGGEIYNCTLNGGGVAARGIWCYTAGYATAINCAVINCPDSFYGTWSSIDHCASDDADGTDAVDLNDNASGEWTASFTDYANGDYRVKDTSSPLYNTGYDLSGTFTNDIVGTTRSTWDIGAFEYVAPAAAAGGFIPIIMNHLKEMRAN